MSGMVRDLDPFLDVESKSIFVKGYSVCCPYDYAYLF